MARVVQRRGNPPYLLILFVFLFLLAATLAIVFYNSSSDNKRAAEDLSSQNNMLASPIERNSSDIGARLAKARSGGGQSVLGQMSTDLHDCVTLLMGSDVPAGEAIANAKALNAPTGLVAEVIKLNDALKAGTQRNDELAAQNKQLQEQVQKDQ